MGKEYKQKEKTPEENQEIKDERTRRINQVVKYIEKSVPKKYHARMITYTNGIVWLKKIVGGEMEHERVVMHEDLRCVKRIHDYVENEVENEIEKEKVLD